MKNQNGITLVSLTIYIIVVIIVIGILTTVRTSFQSGVKEMSDGANAEAEFNKFNLYFLEDIKKSGNKPIIIGQNEITFSLTGNIYKYIDNNYADNDKDKNSLYFRDIKLLSNVSNASFTENEENGKKIITVEVEFSSLQETITKNYTLLEEEKNNNYEHEETYVYIKNEIVNQATNEITNEI